MDLLIENKPSSEFFAWSIIVLYATFAVAWLIDTQFHDKYLIAPDSQGERHTHKLILIPSVLMEVSLITMFWWPVQSLPFFLACYLTRTIQELIDELQWHTKRCTLAESLAHLVMWISVHAKTFLLFIWAFFYGYEGLTSLPIITYIFFAVTLTSVFAIALYDSRSR